MVLMFKMCYYVGYSFPPAFTAVNHVVLLLWKARKPKRKQFCEQLFLFFVLL